MQATRIIIVGSGVAGSEVGTHLSRNATSPLEIIEIECEPERRFGGWGFQSFPDGVTTNLAVRKMFLGDEPNEILDWLNDPEQRKTWPEHIKDFEVDPDKAVPRPLIRLYVKWRRKAAANPLVTFRTVRGEAMHVSQSERGIAVTLSDGETITGDRLVMASGSITVKVPPYLEELGGHPRVILDPLSRDGHALRNRIAPGDRVLILGTGLTGEEQALIMLARGLNDVTLLSRNGKLHYAYPERQRNAGPPAIDETPGFLLAETPEEFDAGLDAFYRHYQEQGHTQEDILAAIRPNWDETRKNLGGCVKAAERLRRNRRTLAVNSIGSTFESTNTLREAIGSGRLRVVSGDIAHVRRTGLLLSVTYAGGQERSDAYDWIINAVGRNIIRHPIWEQLLADGLAKKHAGIGVRVSEKGQMMTASGEASDRIWVVGMARAGDHALRHGYLGNLAFNVPQVRAHVGKTALALLESIESASR